MVKKKTAQPSTPPTWAETLTSAANLAAEKADVLVSSMSSALGATLESITSAVSSPSAGEKKNKELDGKVHSAYLYSLGVQETISAHSAGVRAKVLELKDAAIESTKRSSARVGAALGQDVHEHTAAGLAVFLLLSLLVACLIKSKTYAARVGAASRSTAAATAADNAPGASAADVTSTAATVVSDIVESEEAETETKMECEVEVSGAARAREAADEEDPAPAPSKVAAPSESFSSSGGNASCEEAQKSTPASEFAGTEEAQKSAIPDIPLSAPAAPAAVDAAAVDAAAATADTADDVETVSTEVKSQAPEEPASNELVAEPATPQEQTVNAVKEQAARKPATPDIPLSAPVAQATVDAAAATDAATAAAPAAIADDVKTVSAEVKSQAPEEPVSNELVAEPAAPQKQTVDAVEEQAEEVVGVVTTCDADSFGNVATGSTEFTVYVPATLPEEVVPGPEPTDGASVVGVLSSGASNAVQEAEQEEELLPEPTDAIRAGAEASGEGVANTFQHQLALHKIVQEELPAPAPTVVLPDTEDAGNGVASTLEEAVQEVFQKEIGHEKLEEETETATDQGGEGGEGAAGICWQDASEKQDAEPARPSTEAETTMDQKVAEKAAAVSDVSAIAASSSEGPPSTMTSGAASAMISAAVTAIALAAVSDISAPIALATDEPADKPITMAGDRDSSKDEDASVEGGDAPEAAAPSTSVPPACPDHFRWEQGEVAAATGSRGDATVEYVFSGAADEMIVAGAGAATSVVPEEVANVVGSTCHVGEITPLGVQNVAAAPDDGDALSSAVDAKGLFGSGSGVGENEGEAVTAGAAPTAAAEEGTEEEDVIASSMVEQEQETVGTATAVDGDKAEKQDDTVIPAAGEQAEAASLTRRSEKPEGAFGIAGASLGAEESPSNLSAPIRDPAIVAVAPAAEMSELPRVEATVGAVPAQPAALLEATPGTVATTAATEEAETRIYPEPVVEVSIEAIPGQPMAASRESDEPVTTEKGSDKAAAPGTAATLEATVAATGAFFPLLTDVGVKSEEDMTGQASAEVIPVIPTKPGVAVEETAEPAALAEGSEEVTEVTTSSAVTANVDVEAEHEARPEPELGLEVEAPPGTISAQPAVTVEKTNQPATLKEDCEEAATPASATTAAAAKEFFALVADVDSNAEEEPTGQSAFEGITMQPAAAVEEAFGPIAPVENSGGSTPVTRAWAAEAQTRVKAEPETQPELEVEVPPEAIPAQPAVTIEKTYEPARLKEDSEEAAPGMTATSAATTATAKAFFASMGDVEVNAGIEPKGQGASEAIPTQPAVAVEGAFGRMAPVEDLEGVTSLTTASAAAAQAGMKAKVEPDLELNTNVYMESIPTQPATTASEIAEPVALVEGSGKALPGTMATSKGTAAAANLLFSLVNDVEVNAEEEPGGWATVEANRAQPASAIEEASEPTVPVEDSGEATSGTTASAAAAQAEMEVKVQPDSELNFNVLMEAIPTHPAMTAGETAEPVALVEGSDRASPGTTATPMATAAAAKPFFALVAGVEGEVVPESEGQATVEANRTQPAVAVEGASEPTAPVEDSEGATSVTTGSAAAAHAKMKTEVEPEVEPDLELNLNVSMESIPTPPATTVSETDESVVLVEGTGIASPGTTATSMATAAAAKPFFALVASVGGEVVPEPEGQATVEVNRTHPAVPVEVASEPTAPVEDFKGAMPVTTGSAAAAHAEMKTGVEPDSELNLNVPMEAILTHPATTASETAEPVALAEGSGIASPGTTATSMATAAAVKSFFALVADVETEVVPEPEGQATVEVNRTQPTVDVEEASEPTAPVEDSEGGTSVTTGSAAAALAETKTEVEPNSELNLNVSMESIPIPPATTVSKTAEPVALVEGSGIASSGTTATSRATAAAAKSFFALVADVEGEVVPEPEGQGTVEVDRTHPAVAVEEASEPTAPVEDSEGGTSVTTGSAAAAQAAMETEVGPDSELNTSIPMEAIPTHPATIASETVELVAPVEGSGRAAPGTTATPIVADVGGEVVAEPAPKSEFEAPMEAIPTQPAAAGETAKPVELVEDSGKAATSMATAAAAKALFALVTDVEEEAVPEPAPKSEFEAPIEAIPTQPAMAVGEAAKPAALAEDSGGAAPETTKVSTVTSAAAKMFFALVEDEGGEVSSDEKSEKTEDVEGDQAAKPAAGDGHEAAASGAKSLESPDVFPSPFVAYAGPDPAKNQKHYDDMVLELGTSDPAVTASEASPSNKHHSLSASFFRRRRDRSGEGSDLEGGKEHPSRRKMLKKLNPFKGLRRKSSDKPT